MKLGSVLSAPPENLLKEMLILSSTQGVEAAQMAVYPDRRDSNRIDLLLDAGATIAVDALLSVLKNDFSPRDDLAFLHIANKILHKSFYRKELWLREPSRTLETCQRILTILNDPNAQKALYDMDDLDAMQLVSNSLHIMDRQLDEIKQLGENRAEYFSQYGSRTKKYDIDDKPNRFLAAYAEFLQLSWKRLENADLPENRVVDRQLDMATAFNAMADPDLSYETYDFVPEMDTNPPHEEFMEFILSAASKIHETYMASYHVEATIPKRWDGYKIDRDCRFDFETVGYELDKDGKNRRQPDFDFGRDEEARLSFCDHYPNLAQNLRI